MKDLAPKIFRQRLVIEGIPNTFISDSEIINYLNELCFIIKMKKLADPVVHKSEKYGWAAWMHWETSGVHFYAWDQPQLFFSIDIYTCKKFEPKIAVEFTKQFFKINNVEHKNF